VNESSRKLPEVLRFTRNEIRILVLLTLIFLVSLAFREWHTRRLAKQPVSPEERAFEQAFLRRAKAVHAVLPRKVPPTPAEKMDLNTATIEELTSLPGIGPKTAAAIVALRKRRGKYRSIGELLLVKGIGKKKLKRLQGRVTVDVQKKP